MRHIACQSNRSESGRVTERRVRGAQLLDQGDRSTDQALGEAVSESCKTFGVPDVHVERIFRAEHVCRLRLLQVVHTPDSASHSKMVSPAVCPGGSPGWTLNFLMRDQVLGDMSLQLG